MNASFVRRLGLGVAVACLFPFLATPARAIENGDRAPDFEGRDYYNTDPVSLKDLRGRVVLLELFSVT